MGTHCKNFDSKLKGLKKVLQKIIALGEGGWVGGRGLQEHGTSGHMEYLPQILLFTCFLERPQDPSLEILVILWVEEADFGPSICGVYHCDSWFHDVTVAQHPSLCILLQLEPY